MRKKILTLIGFIIICQLAGIVGSIFTFSAIPNWYQSLNKPFFTPPNWLFGPVWIILYILMAIAVFFIWEIKPVSDNRQKALIIFFVQLLLNTIWSIIFFGFKNPSVAFGSIILLWFLILLTIIKFYKLNKTAGFLLIPYILWVSYASLLNLAIVILN